MFSTTRPESDYGQQVYAQTHPGRPVLRQTAAHAFSLYGGSFWLNVVEKLGVHRNLRIRLREEFSGEEVKVEDIVALWRKVGGGRWRWASFDRRTAAPRRWKGFPVVGETDHLPCARDFGQAA